MSDFFTGIPGSPNAVYGNVVLGAVSNFGATAPGMLAHQIEATKVRLVFGEPLTSSALSPARYVLASLAAPGTAVVPSIRSVAFGDESRSSVVLELFDPLTTGTDYSVEANGIWTESGFQIQSLGRNFTANVHAPAIAYGAFLSKRGAVDVLFDRDVGPNSAAATFQIRDAVGGPAVAMTQLAWGGESIPAGTLRLQLPPGMPTADSFVIEYAAVRDDSLNQSSGSVPLTLALRSPAPYDYADLTQLQIIDAFVTDVSSDYLQAGTVRVFFNAPTYAGDPLNWTVSAKGAHRNADTVNPVTAPDAFDAPTLLTLVNQFKARFNAHLAIELVHLAPASADFISMPDAMDLPTAYALINEAQAKLAAHFLRERVHSYKDTVNALVIGDVNTFGHAVAVANISLKGKFNSHMAATYPMQLSGAYYFLGQVSSYASSGFWQVRGPHTWYADLRVRMDQDAIPVLVTASVTSEDGGSSTNPADYTGSIEARPLSDGARLQSVLVEPDSGLVARFDRQAELQGGDRVAVTGPGGQVRSSAVSRTSYPVAMWAYNNAVFALLWHFDNASIHQVQDLSHFVGPSDLATPDVATSIPVVNNIKAVLNAHMSSSVYHFGADFDLVTAPDATDEASLIVLMEAVRDAVASHDVIVGPHRAPGYRIVSAPYHDLLVVRAPAMRDLAEHRLTGRAHDRYEYNGIYKPVSDGQFSVRGREVVLDAPFVGRATRPSLASALPRPGLVLTSSGPRLESDFVEVWFSKDMAAVELTPATLPLTGGSVVQGPASWTGPRTAKIQIQRMAAVAYNLQAVGLTDDAGNPVYP